MERSIYPEEVQQSDKINEILAIEAFSSSGFLILNKTLIKAIGFKAALLFSFYMDRYKYFKKEHPEKNGWFYVTHQTVMSELGMSELIVITYKKTLKNLGLLKVKMAGLPAKEYIQIDFSVLGKIIETATDLQEQDSSKIKGTQYLENQGDSIPRKSRGHIYKDTKEKDTKENDIKNTCENPLSSKEQKRLAKEQKKLEEENHTKEFFPLARKLARIIKLTKNIKITGADTTRWANDIRILSEEQNIPYERIDTALDWYEFHKGGSFVPVIESGISLKEKFYKLENAIERDKRDNQKPLPNKYSDPTLNKIPVGGKITLEGKTYIKQEDGYLHAKFGDDIY